MVLSQYMGRDERRELTNILIFHGRTASWRCRPFFFQFCTLAVENQQQLDVWYQGEDPSR